MNALQTAAPPTIGRQLPSLQQIDFRDATMGWLDFAAPALLGLPVVNRLRAAVATAWPRAPGACCCWSPHRSPQRLPSWPGSWQAPAGGGARKNRPGDLAHRFRRLGAGGSNYDWSWGEQDDERVDRGDPPRARARRQLDRHRSAVRLRPLGGRSSAERSARTLDERPYVFTKGGQPEGPSRTTLHEPDARLAQARGSKEASRGSASRPIDLYQIHWPIPDERDRGGLGGARRAPGRGARAPHRRLQLRASSSSAVPRRSRRWRRSQPPYSLVARDVEERDPALRRARGDRRDRLLADGLRDC